MMLVAVLILSALCVFGFAAQTTVAQAETSMVDVYAINDFHGAVEKMPRIAGYLAKRKAEGAIILNSGDMFQGSMESNSNFGKLLTDCMQEAGFDEMTYGNHEFDWGMDNLRDLAQNSGIPFLGANIYNWSRSDGWGDFADDFADEYIIKEVNGVKVGVIGVIGDDQITSICAPLVQTVGFKDPLPIIKELATELRNEKDCDIVVVSAHDGPQDIVDGDGDTYDQPTTTAGLEEYVDGVFCAHTHSEQRYLVNGLPFLQGKRYGDFVSHMRFSLDNGNVRVQTYENIAYNSLTDVDEQVQSNVQTLIDNSNAAIEQERNQVVVTLGKTLNSSNGIPRLVCNAIAAAAQTRGYSIDLAIVNVARNSLNAGKVTYSDLYEALPFDNTVYIAKVSGKDILNELIKYSGQSMWRVSGRSISENEYYYAAIIDYLLFHQNTNRSYNYFRSAFESGFEPIPITKQGEQVYNYRLITRDFLQQQGGIVDTALYTTLNIHTDPSQLTKAVDLPIEPYKFGGNLGGNGNLGGLPTYAVVLIVVGAVLVVGIVTVVIVVVVRKRKKSARQD